MNEAKRLFLAALELPALERRAFVAASAAAEEHKQEVVELLAAAEAAGDSLADASEEGVSGSESPAATGPSPGECFGPFTLVRRLGVGGFGEVWLADQTHPVERQVALKLLRPGLATDQLRARFDAEKDTQARMSHSNIARVLDAGTTAEGQPFIAIEYVDGPTITEYCASSEADLATTLQLFAAVCRAVAHAHDKAVIHRDIKPANVLVAREDDGPVPKVIDFGIAKLTEAGRSVGQTVEGQIMGTPVYMSPEQLEYGSAVADVRSDVYALGVLLFELLAGRPPIDLETLRSLGVTTMLRRLIEFEHRPPSRCVDDSVLSRQLAGDLDLVVLKALDRDPERRYRTAHDLAQDIDRYLRHEPVTAAPPTATYRLRKFVRRHRLAVSAAIALLLVFAAGVAGILWQAAEAHRERDHALAALARADAVQEYLTADLLRHAAPEEALGRKITVEEVFRDAADTVGTRFKSQPQVEAALRYVVGRVLRKLGLHDKALVQLRRSYELRKKLHGADHRLTLTSARDLASLLLEVDHVVEGRPLLDAVLQAAEDRFGEHDQLTMDALRTLAAEHERRHRFNELLPLQQRILTACETVHGNDDPRTFWQTNRVAQAYDHLEDHGAAEQLYRKALAGLEHHHKQAHPDVLATLHNLAALLSARGRLDEANETYNRLIEVSEKVYGVEHPEHVPTINGYATLLQNRYRATGDRDSMSKSLRLFRQSLAIRRKLWGDEHSKTAVGLNNLGVALMVDHRSKEAIPILEEGLRIREKIHSRGRGYCATKLMLAHCLAQSGQFRQADALLTNLLKEHEDTYPKGSLDRAVLLMVRASSLTERDKELPTAAAMFTEAYEAYRSKLGANHTRAQTCASQLQKLYEKLGKAEEAVRWKNRSVEKQQ